MNVKKLNILVEEYNSVGELGEEDKKLLDEARKSLDNAYAPYSRYHVGSAVLLENGQVFTGNNQENVAYPSGLCAERVALFYAQSHHPDKAVKTIAIVASALDFKVESPVTPCGSCRQAIAEYENRHDNKIRIIMQGATGKILAVNGINNLLPMVFQADELKK